MPRARVTAVCSNHPRLSRSTTFPQTDRSQVTERAEHSTENAGRIRHELCEAGRLVQKLAVEHYRREHCWKTLAAACVLPGDPDKDKKAGGKMTKAEVDASFEQIAADLRKRAPDLTL